MSKRRKKTNQHYNISFQLNEELVSEVVEAKTFHLAKQKLEDKYAKAWDLILPDRYYPATKELGTNKNENYAVDKSK